MANANAHDNFAKVDPPSPDYATKQITVRTSTLDSGGGTILPYYFGQAVTGVKGKKLSASATAGWGGLQSSAVVPLALSKCEFNRATTNNTVFGAQTTIAFHQTSSISCPGSSSSGADLPGGFGWLKDEDSSPNDCTVTPSAGGTLKENPGNSAPASCNLSTLLGTDVVLAIYDDLTGGGSNGIYHIYGFAELHLTGYTFPSGGSGGVTTSCTSNACVVGKFIKFVPTGSYGGPNVGNAAVLVS